MAMAVAARLVSACLFVFCLGFWESPARAQLKRVVILGDSLTSGFNLPEGTDFGWALRKRLYWRGRNDFQIINSSRAGDTSDVGLQRIPLAFGRGADLVIVELGGNDMKESADPRAVYRNLGAIVARSKARGARVILAGMVSLPKRDPTYKPRFDGVYRTLAARERVAYYPFFLDGAFGNPAFMQSDGQHPNAAGSDLIAARMAPLVDRELGARDRRAYGHYGYVRRTSGGPVAEAPWP
jgi:acyl-CoA thioesterase I